MQNNNKNKICIVVTSLSKGGAEKSAATLSLLLDRSNYNVHIVSILDAIDYEYGGTLFNLGKTKKNYPLNRLFRFFIFKRFLTKQKFDVIIDSRPKQNPLKELLIRTILYRNFKCVYWIHSYNLKTYIPDNSFFRSKVYNSKTKIITVSKSIKSTVESKFGFHDVDCIYNAINVDENDAISEELKPKTDDNFILFAGRLDNKVKNLELLVNAFKRSSLVQSNIKLFILGNGPDEEFLKQLVSKLGLKEHVKFIPFTAHPKPYFNHAKFLVLTSHYEGFPMVLPEALSVGTPVISVNCLSGPSEIINHEINGLLVENYNEEKLADAMNRFIFDENLYNTCVANSKRSISHLSFEEISKKWVEVLNRL